MFVKGVYDPQCWRKKGLHQLLGFVMLMIQNQFDLLFGINMEVVRLIRMLSRLRSSGCSEWLRDGVRTPSVQSILQIQVVNSMLIIAMTFSCRSSEGHCSFLACEKGFNFGPLKH